MLYIHTNTLFSHIDLIRPYDNDDPFRLYVLNQKSHIFSLDPIQSAHICSLLLFLYIWHWFFIEAVYHQSKNFYMINFAHANSLDQKMLLIWIRENSCFAQRMNKQCVLIFTSLSYKYMHGTTQYKWSWFDNNTKTSLVYWFSFVWCSPYTKRLNREARSK